MSTTETTIREMFVMKGVKIAKLEIFDDSAKPHPGLPAHIALITTHDDLLLSQEDRPLIQVGAESEDEMLEKVRCELDYYYPDHLRHTWEA